MILHLYNKQISPKRTNDLEIKFGQLGKTIVAIKRILILSVILSFVFNFAYAELICPNCNTVLDKEAKFCYQCGKLVAKQHCNNCNSELPDSANFCSFCGTAVSITDDEDNTEKTNNIAKLLDAKWLATAGYESYSYGQYEAAACFYKLAALYEPTNYEYIHSAMVSSFDAGDCYSVFELIKKLIALQPNNAEPYLELRVAYEENPSLYPSDVVSILGEGYLRTKDEGLADYDPQKRYSFGNNSEMSTSTEDSNTVNSSFSEAQTTSIQEKLVTVDLLKASDTNGIYGDDTIAAVKAFQNWVNATKGTFILKITGECDDLTLAYLDYAVAHDMKIAVPTSEPIEEPTEALTPKPSIGKPAINIGSSVYQSDGITYINDSTVIFSWMADGQVDSYIVSLVYEDGTEYSLGSTTDTSKTLSTDQLQPGKYKLFVGAIPAGSSEDDIVTNELWFAIPKTTQEIPVNTNSTSLPVYIPTSTPDITEGKPVANGMLSTNGTLTEKTSPTSMPTATSESSEAPDFGTIGESSDFEAFVDNAEETALEANPIIVPYGETRTITTQILPDGTARRDVSSTEYETLTIDLKVDAFKDFNYFERNYGSTYNLQGGTAAIEFDLTLKNYNGTVGINPQNFLLITLRGDAEEDFSQGYQLMDEEIAGKTDINVTNNETITLYKRYPFNTEMGDMHYMVVTAFYNGKEIEYWFDIEPEQQNSGITHLDSDSPADQIQTAQMALYLYGLLDGDSANPGKLDSATLQAFALFQQKVNEQYGMNLYVIDPEVDSSVDTMTLDCLLQQNLVLN